MYVDELNEGGRLTCGSISPSACSMAERGLRPDAIRLQYSSATLFAILVVVSTTDLPDSTSLSSCAKVGFAEKHKVRAATPAQTLDTTQRRRTVKTSRMMSIPRLGRCRSGIKSPHAYLTCVPGKAQAVQGAYPSRRELESPGFDAR